MVPHTQSYLAFKSESERLTNLVVLFSYSVPALMRVLSSPAASALVPVKPDNFPHDKTTGPTLTSRALGYDQDLARITVLSVYSYFEAYVRGALKEIYDRQGGPDAFVALAERRVCRHWSHASGEVAEAKRKLQDADKKGKSNKYLKYSKVLADAGFAFPPDYWPCMVLGSWQRSLSPRAEINPRRGNPDLLSDSLLLNVGPGERQMFGEIRALRNRIAHGSIPVLGMHAAVKKTAALRAWAARIDAHIGKHFLVLQGIRPLDMGELRER